MALYKFKPATSGEHLFSYITTNLIGRKNINQIYELEALQIGGRQYQLSSYYTGVLAANILTRCLKKANRIVSLFEDEREHQKQMAQYFQRSLEIPRTPSGADLDRLAALTLEAEKNLEKELYLQSEASLIRQKLATATYADSLYSKSLLKRK